MAPGHLPPIVGGWTYCDESRDRCAEEMARTLTSGGYWKSVKNPPLRTTVGDHLTKMKGYEAYKAMQENVNAPGRR